MNTTTEHTATSRATSTDTADTDGRRRARHPFRRSVIAGAAVPVLVAGQFAMMAVVPVAVVVVTTWRNRGLRRLRPWAGGLAALYGLALALWAIGPDRAPSLSKDMDPMVALVVSLAGGAFATRAYLLRQRPARD